MLEANKPIIFEKETIKTMIEAKQKIYNIFFNGSQCEKYRKSQKKYIQENGELRENMSIDDMFGNSTTMDFVLHIDYENEDTIE